MLTADALAEVAAALDRGELPSERARLLFLGCFERWRAGLPWDQAAGLCGALALQERNAALLQCAGYLTDGDPGPWELAGRLHRALQRPRLGGPFEDAARRGAADLGRRQLYEILRAETSTPGG